MSTAEIIETLKSIKIGDMLIINDWKAKYTVCGLSEHFALAHYGQYYTIIRRQPMPDDYDYNGVRGGDIACAPDWWIFGYINGYDFRSKKWVNEYMASLESGDTEMSQKKHETVRSLLVVGHKDNVYRQE